MANRFAITLLAILLSWLAAGAACAGFFGFGSDDRGKTGLDFNRGYDRNTVVTVTGRVTSPPHRGESGQYLVGIQSGSESLTLAVGPEAFWEKSGIPIRLNDELTAKGSKAQGEDGRLYLLTQKVANRSTGSQLELRTEKGEPAWSGRGGAAGSGRLSEGAGVRGGMMRGGGMMGGAGGMMRR